LTRRVFLKEPWTAFLSSCLDSDRNYCQASGGVRVSPTDLRCCGPQKVRSISRGDLLQPIFVVQSTEHLLNSYPTIRQQFANLGHESRSGSYDRCQPLLGNCCNVQAAVG